MRTSIGIAIIILAVAAGIAWQDEARIRSVRAGNAGLIASARASGIQIESSRSGHESGSTKRPREDRKPDGGALAGKLLEWYRRDESTRTREQMLPLMEEFDSLDEKGFREFFAKLHTDRSGDDKSRKNLIDYALFKFSMRLPGGALKLVTESPGMFEPGTPMVRNAINAAVSQWSRSEPNIALEWYRKNQGKSQDLSTEGTRDILVSGVAVYDSQTALRLVAEFGFGADKAASILGSTAPDNRKQALAELRDYVKAEPEARKEVVGEALAYLSRKTSGQDFEKTEMWLESANLTPGELEIFAKNLNADALKSRDTGRLIDWMGKTTPSVIDTAQIDKLVSRWAEDDYRATADWLTSIPDGRAKTLSIRSYAATVAKYDPESATQWASTLPYGEDRDETLKSIYHNWPKEDEASKAAAQAFARQHGIEATQEDEESEDE